MRNGNQILQLHGDQITCEENIYRVNLTPALAKISGDTNVDARSVGGS